MTAFRMIASLLVALVLVASPGFGGEAKGGSTITDQEAAVLSNILRVLRRTDGEFPKTRNDAVILAAQEMGKVSYPVSEAMSPFIYFEIANTYWHGWGDESQDFDQAYRFYTTASDCFGDKVSQLYLTFATNATNLGRDDPAQFINLMAKIQKFQASGTVKDLYEFQPIDSVLRTRSLRVREEFKAAQVEIIKKDMDGTVMIISEEGSLRRFAKNAKSLKAIAEAMPDTNIGKKADELLDTLQKTKPPAAVP